MSFTTLTPEEEELIHFVLKITTTADINNTDRTFTFYTEDTNYMVDWGENNGFETITTGDASHTFNTAGEKIIRFKNLNDIYINNSIGRQKYTSIEQWGTALWNADMSAAFSGASNLTMNEDAGTPNMNAVTNMSAMFRNASAFNQYIGGWNVSKVTNMSFMFAGARAFNQDIGNWTVSKVVNMNNMFASAIVFNKDIGDWIVSKVINMSNMFIGASDFNKDIGDWTVSKVTNMRGMFNGAHAFNQDIGDWTVFKVTDMSTMFFGARAFNQDIGDWTVSEVKDMSYMFFGTRAFNQDIGGWTVSKVTRMRAMFNDATAFNQDIGSWNVSEVINMSDMFGGVTLSQTNYEELLVGWNGLSSLQRGVTFSGGNSKYCSLAARVARANLRNEYGWTITDGGVCRPATVVTRTVSEITSTSAQLGGTVSNPEGVTITSTGIVYSSSNQNPEIDVTDIAVTKVEIGNSSGVFSKNITDLTPSTTYYYRPYVVSTSDNTTNYGDVVSFTTSTTLSNEDFELAEISISPNPTNGILNITVAERTDYSLFSITGKTLKKGTLATGKSKIDISSFAKGVYFLNIKTSKGSFTKKVVRC